MKTLTSASGKKAVNVTNSHGSFVCMFVQIDHENQREHVLESKTYKTEKAALNYASKMVA